MIEPFMSRKKNLNKNLVYLQMTLITAFSELIGGTPPMLFAVQYTVLPFSSLLNDAVRTLFTSKSDPTGRMVEEVLETSIFCLYQVMFDIGLLPFAKQVNVISFDSFTSTLVDGDKITSETGTIKKKRKIVKSAN